ncbi:MAG: hypothetical protein ACFE8E_02715 [Candidatus Hodarchaeota archaeon]
MDNFSKKKQKEVIEPEQLCEIFLLYFDEEFGPVPLLITPDESLKDNLDIMRLIRIHSIWFLDISDQTSPDRMDLEYKEKIYFAKKFLISSKREKRRSGSEEDLFETLVLILALPIDMDIFGGTLLKKMAERIIKHFSSKISHLIDAEVAKTQAIKTPTIKSLINIGEAIKKRIKVLIKNTCSQYFQSVIKRTDSTTFKLQKAISYLSLKGVPINYIFSEEDDLGFSNVKLFESKVLTNELYGFEKNFRILRTDMDKDTQEVEILIKNQSKNLFNNICAKVISIQEFFESEVLREKIEKWVPEEELIIVSPIYSTSHEYFLYIIDASSNQTLFKQRLIFSD